MTVSEFSNQFDILYNNITSNQAPGLNEYEKSVFLTKAQEEIIKNYFNAKGNKYQDGFDDSPKRQSDFGSLIRVKELNPLTELNKFDRRSTTISYHYPSDVFIVLNEQLYAKGTSYVVVPISYSEYDRLMSKPYKLPPKFQAWRLITSVDIDHSIVEIIGVFKEAYPTYTIRYLKRPKPIILGDIEQESGLTINGEGTQMTSELPDEIHEEILQRAVELAKVAWAGDLTATIQTGQRSE